MKTHLPFSRAPWSAQAKYVYVARNPFDCAVSFYHHTRGFVRKGVAGDWRSHFSAAQARALAEKFRTRAAGTALEGLWPGLVADALE